MYSKAFSILPTACWTDYVIERIKYLLCQQGNYIWEKIVKLLPKISKLQIILQILDQNEKESLYKYQIESFKVFCTN